MLGGVKGKKGGGMGEIVKRGVYMIVMLMGGGNGRGSRGEIGGRRGREVLLT